jgi:hypothetical protein
MGQIRSEAAKRERNARGSAADRRARRAWIVSPAAGFGGDDVKVPCVHCAAVVLAAEADIDRIVPGDSYRRGNIQPACRPCNLARSDNPDWVGVTGWVGVAKA